MYALTSPQILLMRPQPNQMRLVDPLRQRVEQQQQLELLPQRLLLALELARLAVQREPSDLAVLAQLDEGQRRVDKAVEVLEEQGHAVLVVCMCMSVFICTLKAFGKVYRLGRCLCDGHGRQARERDLAAGVESSTTDRVPCLLHYLLLVVLFGCLQ